MTARILVIIVTFLGILNQPYAYYEFLRVFVFIVTIILTIQAFKRVNKNGFEYLYLTTAILYNPIIPIYASKETWVIFNILTIILIGISLSLDKENSGENLSK